MTYLWLQTINRGTGDAIDPAAIPAKRLAGARTAIEAALAQPAGALLWAGAGHTLTVTAEGRKLLATIAAPDGASLVTMGVAPSDRDGAKIWRMMLAMAEREGISTTLRRPQEPWAVVMVHGSALPHLDLDAPWLPMIEVELACAWLSICDDHGGPST